VERIPLGEDELMPPLVLVAVAWIAGLAIAHHVFAPARLDPLLLLLPGLLPIVASILWRHDRRTRLASICCWAFLLAALRYQAQLPDWQDTQRIARHNDTGWITFEGVIQAYPRTRDTWTELRIRSESIELEDQVYEVKGTVLVLAPPHPEYGFGDRLRVSGSLKTPPELEAFSYRDHLARQRIYSIVQWPQIEKISGGHGSAFAAVLFAMRDRARDLLARLVPEPEASLLQGILLGIESGIPRQLLDNYNATGTSHIIVISGANFVIVIALLEVTFGRLLGRKRGYWLTMAGMLCYTILVGADPVVLRAGIMGGLYVTARYLGRRALAYVSLAASIILLTAINPFTLWDPGLQLSAAATLSLIFLVPPMERALDQRLQPLNLSMPVHAAIRYLGNLVLITAAAQLLTVPLILHRFGRLSLVSPLANLLILPVQPPLMAFGAAALLVGMVPLLEPIAQLIAWIPWLCLAYTNWVVRSMASWPYAAVDVGDFHLGLLLACYGLIAIALWARRLSTHEGRTTPGHPKLPLATSVTGVLPGSAQGLPGRLLSGLFLATLILSGLALRGMPDGRLHVAFLDVGQGDAILITTPAGRQILVDGGPSPAALTSALGKEMPFWDRSLDMLVMTHTDADHITGLAEVLDRYQVDRWLESGIPDQDPTYLACRKILAKKAIPDDQLRAGHWLDLGHGIKLEVLHPPGELLSGTTADANNNSLVLRLVWNDVEFLLAGDVEAPAEQYLMRSGQPLSACVLKVGHHGSAQSSTTDFLSAVSPSFAVISAGSGNAFGLPDEAVLQRLARYCAGCVLRTDEHGTVEFVTAPSPGGQKLWIYTERMNPTSPTYH
jgi:competence protein ComEC